MKVLDEATPLHTRSLGFGRLHISYPLSRTFLRAQSPTSWINCLLYSDVFLHVCACINLLSCGGVAYLDRRILQAYQRPDDEKTRPT